MEGATGRRERVCGKRRSIDKMGQEERVRNLTILGLAG